MDAVPHITRTLEPFLARVVAQFPPVLRTGPRQSGKTTLLRRVLAGTHADVSLEAPEARLRHGGSPWLHRHYAPPVVLDDVQKRRCYTG